MIFKLPSGQMIHGLSLKLDVLSMPASNSKVEKLLDAELIRVGPLEWKVVRKDAWKMSHVLPDGTSINGVRLVGSIIWIPKSDSDVEAKLDSFYLRVSTLKWDTTKKPDAPGFFEKVQRFVRTVTSGKATAEQIELRKLSCFGNATQPPCPKLKITDSKKYCGACSCGAWQLAELDGGIKPKLEWAGLRCPLGRPGFHGSA